MTNTPERKLFIASCLGFCHGVERALALFQSAVESSPEPLSAVESSPEPLYVLYELVHNRAVSAQMRQQGAIFISSLEQAPPGSRLLLGAHGLPREMLAQIRQKNLRVIDATCPLVKKLHTLASEIAPDETLLLLGKAGHPEAIGILGHSGSRNSYLIQSESELEALPMLNKPVLLTQTTLNHRLVQATREAFSRRFPDGRSPVNICNASSARQQAIEALARQAELVLVIGSKHSSNANRLCECARQAGSAAQLIEDAEGIPEAVQNLHRLGLGAGASTPEYLITQTIAALLALGFVQQPTSPSPLPFSTNGQ